MLVRQRFSARNPGQVTGYAVALPGDTGKDGGPVWFGGGKLAADLSWPKLRCRWAGPGTAPGDPFTAAERNAIWDHAARSADQAAAQIRALAGTDPAAAADAAWAASDTLHAAAAALRSRLLRQAADAYDRAARAPYARIPAPTPAGNSLRRAARLISAYAYLAKDPSLAPVVLILRLASLAEAVAELRAGPAARRPGRRGAASRRAAARRRRRHAAPGRSGPRQALSPAALAGASFPRPAPPRPGRPPPRPPGAGPPPALRRRPAAAGTGNAKPAPITPKETDMTIDPSAHHADPFGEAFSHSSQKAAQFISMAGAAYEIAARRKAIRAAREAARNEQQRQALQEQERAARARPPGHGGRPPSTRGGWPRPTCSRPAVSGAPPPRTPTPTPRRPRRCAGPRSACGALHPYAMARYDRLRVRGSPPAGGDAGGRAPVRPGAARAPRPAGAPAAGDRGRHARRRSRPRRRGRRRERSPARSRSAGPDQAA